MYAFGRTAAEASVPGPTIVVESGFPLRIRWANNITDEQHFLPVDHTLMAPKLSKGGVPMGEGWGRDTITSRGTGLETNKKDGERMTHDLNGG